MTITSINDVAVGLSNTTRQTMQWNKASIASQVANTYTSLWRATGVPVQANIPSAIEICYKGTLGAWNFVSPTATLYIGGAKMVSANSGTGVEVHDRLVQMGGLSGVVTTTQTVGLVVTSTTNNLPARLGASDKSELQWWLECYSATGATAVNFTVGLTYTDASTTTFVIAPGANMAAGRVFPIFPTAGKQIQSIDSVTLSATTGTAGNFGFTVTRELTTLETTNAFYMRKYTWAETEIPIVLDNTCLMIMTMNPTTSSGTLIGNLRIINV